jgi:hypothetical protein
MKTFDCVEMKHRGAEKVREQTKDMTVEQEVAFWQKRSRVLKRRQEIAKEKLLVTANEEQRAS